MAVHPLKQPCGGYHEPGTCGYCKWIFEEAVNDAVNRMEWKEFDTPEGFWKKMVEVANLPECKNDRRHEATRWASARLSLAEKVMEAGRALREYAMPENCECMACQNFRDALRAYDSATGREEG